MSGEPDQVKWRGVQPVAGIRGVWPERNSLRIIREVLQDGGGTVVAYTVPVGKILFISNLNLASRMSTDSGKWCWWFIRDDSDTMVYPILAHIYDIAGNQTTFGRYVPAIEVAAAYDVCLYSSSTYIDARGGLFGWLEDV